MTTECSICLEIYTKVGEGVPKLLPCSHTACLWCLQELVKGSSLECPECRANHVLPVRGVAAFPTNRYILELLDLMDRTENLGPQPPKKSQPGAILFPPQPGVIPGPGKHWVPSFQSPKCGIPSSSTTGKCHATCVISSPSAWVPCSRAGCGTHCHPCAYPFLCDHPG